MGPATYIHPMNHKTIIKVALFMLIVYGATVILYPMLFNPDANRRQTVEAPPVQTPVTITK